MENKLATIEEIKDIQVHPNADKLELAFVLGYQCIVPKGLYKTGDKIVFIFPDTVLPDTEWAAFYKARSSRVKAIKLRQVWSFGIVEQLTKLNIDGEIGEDVSEKLGITKYSPPEPQDINAKGNLPFGIPKTDEINYQQINNLPYGELVDVTLKIDGQSISSYCVDNYKDGNWEVGVTSRTLECRLDRENNYTNNINNYQVLDKLKDFCVKNNVSLCLRGESYGSNIQNFPINPNAGGTLKLALFSTYLINEKQYAHKGHPFYIFNIADELNLPIVPIIEKDVILTPQLIEKYSKELTTINDKPFEGVVIQHKNGSFKVINLYYDSKK